MGDGEHLDMEVATAQVLGPIGDLARHAALYADAGLEVFPVNPNDKTPLTSQYDATTHIDTVDTWWERWPKALIGHRLADDHVVFDVDPRHGGYDTWQALKEAVGGLPETRAHASGREDGGGHVWFLRPAERLSIVGFDRWAEERQLGEQAGEHRWVCGIDLLHRTHRYTILPPSPHPDTAKPYTWLEGHGLDISPAPMPALLADLVTAEPPPPPTPPRDPDPDSIADWYTATHRWSDLLGRHGWQLRAGDGNSDGSRWRHPTATSACSATIRHGCLFVYSPNTDFEVTEPHNPHGYTLFRAWATLEHHGDLAAAARAARELKDGPLNDLSWIKAPTPNGDQTDELAHGWETVDLTDVARGDWEPLRPTIGQVTDGHALFYAGRVNGIFGESGSGKSWVAQVACAQELRAARHTIYIDLEDHQSNVVGRLIALGVDPDAIIARFHYISPALAWSPPAAEHLDQLATDATIAVVDSTGEALALDGLKQNDDDEVARWHRFVARRIAAHGPAVVLVDHIPKANDSPSLFQIGSQRKKAAIDGAMYRVEQTRSFGIGQVGSARLIVGKDRNGTHATGCVAADLDIDTSGDGTTTRYTLRRHVGMNDPGFRPTYLMERVSRLLESSKALTQRQIRKNVQGNDAAICRAIEVLIDEGYVATNKQGQSIYHYSETAFRDESDLSWMSDGGDDDPEEGDEVA